MFLFSASFSNTGYLTFWSNYLTTVRVHTNNKLIFASLLSSCIHKASKSSEVSFFSIFLFHQQTMIRSIFFERTQFCSGIFFFLWVHIVKQKKRVLWYYQVQKNSYVHVNSKNSSTQSDLTIKDPFIFSAKKNLFSTDFSLRFVWFSFVWILFLTTLGYSQLFQIGWKNMAKSKL